MIVFMLYKLFYKEGTYVNKATDIVDCTLLSVGTLYSLENIEHILGVIILVIQLAWLCTKLGVAIYKKIKSGGNLSELDGDVGQITGTLGDIIDAVDNLDDKEDEKSESDSKP